MPDLPEITFCIVQAINPAFQVLASPTDFWPNGITLVQYRDTLDLIEFSSPYLRPEVVEESVVFAVSLSHCRVAISRF